MFVHTRVIFPSSRVTQANGSCDEDVGGRVGVVAMGVNDPLNVGSIFRLMGCFGADTFTHCHIGRR